MYSKKRRELFENGTKLSIEKAAETLYMSTATVDRVLCKAFFFFPYKLQNLQALLDSDKKANMTCEVLSNASR